MFALEVTTTEKCIGSYEKRDSYNHGDICTSTYAPINGHTSGE